MTNTLTTLLLQSTLETLYMTLLSGFFAVLGGVPLGIILMITQPNGLAQNKVLYKTLSFIVDVLRAIPFIILLVLVIPFTRFLIGTAIGTNAAIVPLSISAIPFVARIVENALVQIGNGLIELGQAMGATRWQIIYKILLPEVSSSIIRGITLTLIALIGYSAMAGAVGGGGLGSVAINYGYQRFDMKILIATVIILVLLVYFIQKIGHRLTQERS